MKDKICVVVTSIAAPNQALRELAKGCSQNNRQFIVIGDEPSPPDFNIEGCDFYSLKNQKKTGLKFARNCPTRHYARKNIGYLLAIKNNCSVIVETDDDNIPLDDFWRPPQKKQTVAVLENSGWVNVYRYFTDQNIWPRGFSLENINKQVPDFEKLRQIDMDCPIQQGLADDNPDVDAIYRLTLPLPQKFKGNRNIALTQGCFCPFNSQNTTWWQDAFELLYLPSYCSFRMTDIWRSFIAQKIAYINNWPILFHPPTVIQKRNEHNLLKDFKDEIPGYLHNTQICEELDNLPLQVGVEKISDNLKICYEKLIKMTLIGNQELKLLEEWIEDIKQLRKT